MAKNKRRLCTYPVGQKFCRNYSVSHCCQDKCAFALYAEIQDGRQKWWENNFWPNMADKSACSLWAKNFIEITLFRTVSEINVCLSFMQKFKMTAKNGRKTFFGKKCQITVQTLWIKNFAPFLKY